MERLNQQAVEAFADKFFRVVHGDNDRNRRVGEGDGRGHRRGSDFAALQAFDFHFQLGNALVFILGNVVGAFEFILGVAQLLID